MVKILIVEDEQVEREAINLILSTLNGFKVVGEAADGEEAIARARELQPDIIFMDIRIGKVSGLEASRIIKNELPDCEIIIITAYGRFDYSCEALRSGVFDFLLKPVEPDTLLEVANKAKTKIIRKRQETKKHDFHFLKEHVGLVLAPLLLQENFLPDSSLKDLDELTKIFSLLGLKDGCLAVAAVLQYLNPDSKDVINECLSKLRSSGLSMLTIPNFENKILFFLTQEQDKRLFQRSVRETIDALVGSLSKMGLGKQIKIGIGQAYEQLNQLTRSIREAMVALQVAEKVIFYEEIKMASGKESLACAYEELNFVSDLIQKNDLWKALDRIQNLVVQYADFKDNEGISEDLKLIAYEIMLFAMRNVNKNGVEKGSLDKYKHEWQTQWKRCSSLSMLLNWLYIMLSQLKEMQKRYEDIGDERVLQAIEFMEEHYHQDITLTSVAQAINISPQYLSRLFKTKAKATFTDYLNRIRIERAKEFLAIHSYPIKKIALDIGYSSDIYFTYVFKRMTGMTPREYRLQKKIG